MTLDELKKTRSYLGDAVYAELTQYGVKLTTEDGIQTEAYNTRRGRRRGRNTSPCAN